MKTRSSGPNGFFIAALVCFVLAAVCGFVLAGFGMSALVFLGGGLCLVFFGLLSGRKTRAARLLRRAALVILLIGFCCFLAAEIPVLADARTDADGDAPYLIVFGAGVNGTEPSLSMLNRLDDALAWLEAHPDSKAVLSGGQGAGEDITEAQAMYTWLTEKGVSPERLILEEASTDSLENIVNSLALIQADGGDPTGPVALLSSEYHLHRLAYMAQRLGCQAVTVAARTTNPFIFVNYAVREAFAMWELWVFGM